VPARQGRQRRAESLTRAGGRRKRERARAPAGTAALWLWGVLPAGRSGAPRASFRTVAIATIATAAAESSKVRRICHRDMCNRMPRSDSEIARPCRAIGEGIDKRDKLLVELACTASPVAMVITTPLVLMGMLHAGSGGGLPGTPAQIAGAAVTSSRLCATGVAPPLILRVGKKTFSEIELKKKFRYF
jgi:hypothetical protein